MGLAHSPSVVTNGLVYYHDMSNTKKSWKGMPTTNLFGNAVNYSGLNSYWFLLDNNTNYFLLSSSWASWCMSFVCTLAASTQYTLSFEYKTASAGTLVIDNDGVDDNTWNATINTTSEWQKYTFTRTEITAGVMTLYFRRNTGGDIEVRNVQIEANSFASGFVKGTRSTTQSIIDLTGNNTLTATSLTYNSNNTFSFNGSNNYVDCGTGGTLTLGNNGAFTVGAWINCAVLKNYAGIISKVRSDRPGVYSFMACLHNDGTLIFYNNATWSASSNVGLTINTWYYVNFVYNGSGTLSFYVNGASAGTASLTWPETTAHNVFVGSWYSVNTIYDFNGTISVAQLYNRALTAAEVKQNFNALRGRYGI